MNEVTQPSTMPMIRSIPATKYIVNVSKLMSKLPCMPLGQTTNLRGTQSTQVKLTGTSFITCFDVVVHTAVVNLYVAGNQAVTATMVARAMLGHSASSVSSTLCQIIDASIAKMINTSIEIKGPYASHSDSLLRMTLIQARTDNGTVAIHYRFDAEPVLQTYAATIGHLYTFPFEAVNKIAKLNTTIDVVVVQHYVLRRVAVAIRSGRYNTIAYDTLAKECNVPVVKVRRICKAVLNHLMALGCVSSYEEYRQRRKFAGVLIRIAPKTGAPRA